MRRRRFVGLMLSAAAAALCLRAHTTVTASRPETPGALWIDSAGRPDGDARDALAMLGTAADDGLDPSEYGQAQLATMAARLETSPAPAAQDAAAFEAGLSGATLHYLRDLHAGRVDACALGFRLNAPADRTDYAELVRTAVAAHCVGHLAADLRPRLRQYAALRDALARYRRLAGEPVFAVPPLSGKPLRPGDKYAGAEIVYRQLVALGDLAPTVPPPTDGRYAGELVEGVKRFQTRHGAPPDGAIGPQTLSALQVPLSRRVHQIELSMERLRWLPELADRRVILLNIPMFRLWAFSSPRSSQPDLSMAVIVGRALRTQTPVIREEMNEVIFRPYWNVPSSILRHEVLPKLLRDRGYLAKQRMEVVEGYGANARTVPLTADAIEALRVGAARVRQRPGADNSLGLIKFVFPNDYDVYMHGTPAQSLFGRPRRDFSHGCVRVEDPVRLAVWVLSEYPEWTRERIVAATERPASSSVRLQHPIQVILFYSTAAVVPGGDVWFADDVYRADDRLDGALAGRKCR